MVPLLLKHNCSNQLLQKKPCSYQHLRKTASKTSGNSPSPCLRFFLAQLPPTLNYFYLVLLNFSDFSNEPKNCVNKATPKLKTHIEKSIETLILLKNAKLKQIWCSLNSLNVINAKKAI